MHSSILEQLNSSQREAVSHLDGPLLVLAGPGSGKTRVITHRIAHMIANGIRPEEILALTFTNKAADEMRTRLEGLVGPSPVWMGTFHRYCAWLLRRYAPLLGLPENFSIYDMDDAGATLKAAVGEADFELTHVPIGVLANRISYFKNRLVTPEILEAQALSSDEYQAAQVYPIYQQQLLRCGAVDFDDILMHTATLLRCHPEIRSQLDERFRYVMVDEYQDTNLAQYVILRHLCVDYPNLSVTGDPDQSIYGWRGATTKNVTNLERDYPDLKVVRLQENYRSTPEILSIADFLIQYNENRKAKNLLPSRGSGRPVRLAVYPSARQEANDIAQQISDVMATGEGSYSDFGVLYRTNAQSRLIEQALTRNQIPYQLIGGFRFYLRKEVKDLIAYLLLVHNPDDNIALQRAINSPPRGIGKKTLERIAESAAAGGYSMLEACRRCCDQGMLSKRAASAVRGFLKIYDQLCSIVHGPLVDLLEVSLELTQYREHLRRAAERSGQSATENIENLDELLAEAREIDLRTAATGESALEAFLELVALQSDSDRLESGQEKVTLMTLHAAKGLEFSTVFLMAVEENILPHARSKDDSQAIEEERRLLFVGITRAMDHLQLSYAKSRGFSGSGSGVPSSFLLELPRTEMEIVDHTAESDYDSGSAGFDEYFDSGNDDWDGVNQLTDDGDFEDQSLSIDDDCQLPAEERAEMLRSRMGKLGQGRGADIQVASDLTESDSRRRFDVGSQVYHPQYGSGKIVATTGHGPKQSVSVDFFDSLPPRTFRLAQAKLVPHND